MLYEVITRRLFAAGVLPAIDVTKSVSRVGGKSQHGRIKKKAGRMKLDFLQFLELEVFTRFGTVITSYSIHYTKLYERFRKKPEEACMTNEEIV